MQYDNAQTLPLVLAQWGTTALLRAAEGGNVSLVRMLMEEFDCLLDEVNEVSVISNSRCYTVTAF